MATPTTVVASAMTALFATQRAKGCSDSTAVKLAPDQRAGHGVMARSLSQKVGSAGRSAMERLWLPEKAMVTTQSTG